MGVNVPPRSGVLPASSRREGTMKRRGGLAALAITGRSALIGGALALCTLIPAAGWSQQIIEPHQPGWERWFKLDWEAGEGRWEPVVKGDLSSAARKTVGGGQIPC